MPEYF